MARARAMSAEALARSGAFLARRARPLEAAEFAHESGRSPPAAVLAALEPFRNPDGGFGHGLEPDVAYPGSSALATTEALQRLSRLGLASPPPMVAAALAYLALSYDRGHDLWPRLPDGIATHPRATWWEPSTPAESEAVWGNPAAEVAGYLHEWPSAATSGLRDRVTRKAFDRLDGHPELLDPHELLCYLRLAERLPADAGRKLYRRLDRHVAGRVATDPGEWGSYGLRPLKVAPGPRSRYARRLRGAIAANLDFLLDEQAADGSWRPTWSWGRFPDAWRKARVAWSGVLTVENLRALRAFGRLPPRGVPAGRAGAYPA